MDKRLAGVLAAAALAVSACSNGSTATSFVPGGGASTSGSVPTAPSSTPTAAAGLKAFTFPSSIKVEFQTPLPATEPERSAVIAYENYVDSMWYAVYTLGKNKAYQKYTSGNALSFAKQIIAEFKAGRYQLKGTVVYSDITVPNVFGTSGVVVSSCFNDSGLQMVNPGNGRPAGNIINSKYTHSQEQAAAGKQANGSWWIVHTDFYPAASGGSAGVCAS
ncbi:MAG TPA: hypothetical protein VFB06_10705 [Streptosporangiaceae bacterium]|nr:hypothetical protein [Streptosporangiaceae bacterium]